MAWKFTMADLFAGIGGFRLAAEKLGGKCVAFSEIAADAIKAYRENFTPGGECELGDMTRLEDLPDHDLMTGGVPCQSWSIAGRNLGFDDDRGQLWNDAIYLLNRSRPKAFIFENVKGLADPRNRDALDYIMGRVKRAGYTAGFHVIDSHDYGVPQSRVRIYIIGFRDPAFASRFALPGKSKARLRLGDFLDGNACGAKASDSGLEETEGSCPGGQARMSLSANNNGQNDYFLFNDLRGGDTTIHSWDIIDTTQREKGICRLLLKNRRKRIYGCLDGNPLSLAHFQALDPTVGQEDIDRLVDKNILKSEHYSFRIKEVPTEGITKLTDSETQLLGMQRDGLVVPDSFASSREWKVKRLRMGPLLESLEAKGVLEPWETRYDFRNTKISTGLFGVNRIFLPSSSIFPTLVASDSNDYVTSVEIAASTPQEYRAKFIEDVYRPGDYRKISKAEACRIQGFPEGFALPQQRSRWMKLLGNSVSVPVMELLVEAVCKTGVFGPEIQSSLVHN